MRLFQGISGFSREFGTAPCLEFLMPRLKILPWRIPLEGEDNKKYNGISPLLYFVDSREIIIFLGFVPVSERILKYKNIEILLIINYFKTIFI